MGNVSELFDFLQGQGLYPEEVSEIIEFYNLQDIDYDLEEFSINFVEDADVWLESVFDQLGDLPSYGIGDFIDYIKKEFLSDTAKVMYGFAEYLMDDKDDAYMVYCKDTDRVIFFEA